MFQGLLSFGFYLAWAILIPKIVLIFGIIILKIGMKFGIRNYFYLDWLI